MPKLEHITVRCFKSIRELDLDLQSLTVLIGANGVGKSNFLGVFRFLNQIVEGNLQKHTGVSGGFQIVEGNLQKHTGVSGGADSILHFGRKTSAELSFGLSFDDGINGYECALQPTADDRFVFNREEGVWFHDKSSYAKQHRASLGVGHLETTLSKWVSKGGVAGFVDRDLRNWRVYHFHDTSDSAGVKQTGELEDNSALRPDAQNLAAFLYRLQVTEPDHFANIQDAVRMVAPFFDRFDLHPSRLNPERIRLEWKEAGNDAYFNASALSDGSLRFMCLAALLLQPELPSLILLDEPALGLHPYAVTVLAGLLRQAAERAQVVVATQSVTLVNQFGPEDIVVVEREDGQSVFRRLDKAAIAAWLDDYGLGDLWEKNVLGGRP